VPTIYHRALLDVGTLSFCPPGELICLARKRNFNAQLRQTGTTGKSLLIFRNRVKPGNQKYSAFVLTQIIGITPLVSRQMRGARDRHERAVRCDGR
jgi:hypothetical protein